MNKNCIMMVAIEDEYSKHSHKTYFEYTIQSWMYYCKKYSIDFHVIREKLPNVKYSVWHKEFVFDFVGPKYEKIGIVDFDTMIKWDAPNIFDLYEDEFTGVLDQTNIQWMYHSQESYRQAFPQFKNVHVGLSEHINGGVLFFTVKHKYFFDILKQFYLDNKSILDNWTIPNTGKEQTLLNFHIKYHNLKCKYLPYSWNTVGMIRKGLLYHNDKLNDTDPFFLKYCNLWHFTGFPIEQRNLLINQVWDQINHLYK